MNLSAHFTLAELTRSAKAEQLGIDNSPPPEIVPRLVLLAELLERIRTTLGCPVIVTSGYRCERLNMAVGGATTSDHPQGHAADIVAPAFGSATALAKHLSTRVGELGIGQLLLEHVGGRSWTHVSTRIPDKAQNRVLTFNGERYEVGITAIA